MTDDDDEWEHTEMVEIAAEDLKPGDRIQVEAGAKDRAVTGLRRGPEQIRVSINGLGNALNFPNHQRLLIRRWVRGKLPPTDCDRN